MDTNSNFNPMRPGDGEPALPADLVEAAGVVDRLVKHERAAAGSTLEDRLFMATRAAIAQGVPADVADIAVLLDDLGAAERASAAATLEDRVMLASVAGLAERGAAQREVALHIRVRSWTRRVAIAAGLVIMAGGASWLALRPAGTDPVASLESTVASLSSAARADSTTVALDDLRQDLDTLDQSVRGGWFRTESTVDEESL